MRSIKSNFDKILRVLRVVLGENSPVTKKQVKPGPRTKFYDIEVIALACTAECMGYSSENYFFSLLDKKDFPNLLSRRQFNDRRKRLHSQVEEVRKMILSRITTKKRAYVIDSMPLRLCRFSRRNRVKVGTEQSDINPNIGYCASQDEKYFGFKLHAVCSLEGAVQFFDITPASSSDVGYLSTVGKKLKNCHLIGDKGYISAFYKAELREESKVFLFTDSRVNAKKPHFIPPMYKGKRKRIETVFSQLTDQFNIQKNYTKTLISYFNKISLKLLSMTILNYINQHINLTPISRIKYSLS
ncbi:MAG: family transposase [Mucilaginibacter sp.]|nr:family transposase [Mucilaginibacter sp.]